MKTSLWKIGQNENGIQIFDESSILILVQFEVFSHIISQTKKVTYKNCREPTG